jgi:glycine/D-amino acid oxidase-like deaminating enzyme
VLVAGGGIFGVTAALELRGRGRTVVLVDPGPLPHPDAASTDISKAIRMDYGADAFYTSLMEEAFEGWDRWNAEWRGEADGPLYHEDGFIVMSREAMRPGGFEHDSLALLSQRGHPVTRLDSRALANRFPVWNAARYPDGYFNPRAGWAESGRVVASLTERARRAGVEIRTGAPVARLIADGSRVGGVVTSGGEELRAGSVVLTAGAWTPHLLPELSDVMRATGQPVLHFRPADPEPFRAPRFAVWAADISNTGWYGFPANRDGVVKVGHHGPGRRVSPAEPRVVDGAEEPRFRAFLRETFPSLADAPLAGSRLGLYWDTFDGDFWIARDPRGEGRVVAAGDSGHGFKVAPVLGALIADALEERPSPRLARFAWREAGPRRREAARSDEP